MGVESTMTTEKPESAKTKKAHCSTCAGQRNCDVLGHHGESGGDGFLDWHRDWNILRCRGCEHIFVQTVSTNSEDYDHYFDEYGQEAIQHHETVAYWPALSRRAIPDWVDRIGAFDEEKLPLKAALDELYGALENDLNTLASIGIRTTFDIASELLGVDPGLSFVKKLDKLVELGHIGLVDRERLAALVDAGSASAHRGWKPSQEDISIMAEVLEHFIHAAIVAPEDRKLLDQRAALIRKKVPARKAALQRALAEPEGIEAPKSSDDSTN
jgi:hypothetical protein